MAAMKTAMEKEEIKRIEQAELLRDEPKDRFIFDPVEHVYTLDGKPLYGITSVLQVIAKPALIQWSANMACDEIENYLRWHTEEGVPAETMVQNLFTHVIKSARTAHNKKKESAGEAGTEIHEQLEKLIKAAIEMNNGELEAFVLAENSPEQVKEFIQWAIVNKVKFLASEIRLYSETMWVAGTADFICEIDGKLYIGDIKTSSAIYPENFIQTSAYARMAQEMGLYKDFHGVVIVNIPKRGGLKVKENYDIEGNFEAFKAALVLHKFKKAQEIKKTTSTKKVINI